MTRHLVLAAYVMPFAANDAPVAETIELTEAQVQAVDDAYAAGFVYETDLTTVHALADVENAMRSAATASAYAASKNLLQGAQGAAPPQVLITVLYNGVRDIVERDMRSVGFSRAQVTIAARDGVGSNTSADVAAVAEAILANFAATGP